MKNFKILLFLSMAILSIVSCTKEDIASPEIIDPIIEVVETSHNPLVAQVNSSEGFDLGCFSIDLPFDLTVDGIVTPIGSVNDFEIITNAGENAQIDFVYPIDITYEDGETAVVADGMELGEAFAVCVPDDGWNTIEGAFPAYIINTGNSCYDLVFPLTLTDLDQNSVTIEDEAAFIDALAINDLLLFGFPLSLINTDGEEVTAADDEELFALFFECEEIHPPSDDVSYISGSIACYDLTFPLSVIEVDANGNQTSVVVEDENQLNNSLLNGNSIGFAYPLTLIFQEDGSQVIVPNEEELFSLISDCYNNFVNFNTFEFLAFDAAPDASCYVISFPISLTNEDGSVLIEVNSSLEALGRIFDEQLTVSPVYPVNVTKLEDGTIVTLNNEEDLIELLDYCL